MKVSLNTIRQFTEVSSTVPELVRSINAQLGKVEHVIDLHPRYQDAVIAKIVQCEKHPNADKLSVCKIDVGVVEPVTVVCGAPNVQKGLFVVWLPPGSTVPSSVDDSEPFVLGARELRGVVSHGMLASPKELALGDNHEGILELDSGQKGVAPGASFSEVFGLNDTIIDIENKMFTHRPDCFGQLGVAREIAGINHRAFHSPQWYTTLPKFNSGEGLPLTVKNEAGNAVPRFMAAALTDVTISPSPVWLQAELVRLGSKPINNVVDITNYVMLITGQPLHAYDYDKLRGQQLIARSAKPMEKTTLLNGKEYRLSTDDIVIADGEGSVGLGGVMGGGTSEVSSSTKKIVLECANFDMYVVRKTSMRHGLFTEAVTRFNKGQSSVQNDFVMAWAMQLLFKITGATLASQVYDAHGAPLTAQKSVLIDAEFINARLGLELSDNNISKLLTNVEFSVEPHKSKHGSGLKITPPFWRTDIGIPEDIVEEVGRLYGFESLPRQLPTRALSAEVPASRLRLKQAVRESFYRSGANEVLTYSFVHERTINRAEQDVSSAYRLSNAISPDLQYYRLTVLPSLLERVRANIKTGYDEFVLFEVGKGHDKNSPLENGLPTEVESVDAIYTSKNPKEGAALYRIRRLVTQLGKDLHIPLEFVPAVNSDLPLMSPFDTSRSALVVTGDNEVIGLIGELKQSVIKSFKLPSYSAALSLELGSFEVFYGQSRSQYRPLPRFQGTSKDISLRVSPDVLFNELHDAVRAGVDLFLSTGPYTVQVEAKAIYQPDTNADKTITFSLHTTSYEDTISTDETATLLDMVTKSAAKMDAVVV